MGIFGWDYPPGCSGTPFDEPDVCEVCGGDPDSSRPEAACICPVCPVCGQAGDPDCYVAHGLVKSPEQEAALKARTADWGDAREMDLEPDIENDESFWR